MGDKTCMSVPVCVVYLSFRLVACDIKNESHSSKLNNDGNELEKNWRELNIYVGMAAAYITLQLVCNTQCEHSDIVMQPYIAIRKTHTKKNYYSTNTPVKEQCWTNDTFIITIGRELHATAMTKAGQVRHESTIVHMRSFNYCVAYVIYIIYIIKVFIHIAHMAAKNKCALF